MKADVFADLRTQDGNLSIYEVSESVSPERIATAMAATRGSIQHIDYVLIDSLELGKL